MEKTEVVEDIGHSFQSDLGYMIQTDGEVEDESDHIAAENTDDSSRDAGEKSGAPLREQDRFLPIANVAKIMKRAIPESGKIAKDARECVQECVSEFISFITSEASEKCYLEKRKTINGEDILYAMSNLGFDNYIEPLKIYLQKYRESAKSDRNIHQNDVVYEEMTEENYTAPIQTSIIATAESGPQETVIYTYQDNLNNIHQFQIA